MTECGASAIAPRREPDDDTDGSVSEAANLSEGIIDMASSINHSAQLFDIHEIQQVLYKYAIAIDTREYDLLDECFSEDFKFHISDGWGVFSREEYKNQCRTVLPPLEATQHLVCPPVIQLKGDAAVSRAYFLAQHARNSLAPQGFLWIAGWYDDEFARIRGKWLITKRVGTPVWCDGNQAVLDHNVTLGGLNWTSYRACPSWLSPSQ